MQRRARRLMGVAAAAALVAVGCGGDDNGQSAAEKQEYCDAITAIETEQGPDIDFASASPEEMATAAKTYARETLRPLADRAIAAAPESLADEYRTLNGAVTQLEETGDFEAAFTNPGVEEASATAHEYDVENCGWEKVDVKALDYKYEGVPRTIDAGLTSFEMENEGKEVHEISVARKNDGVTETFDQILELPEEEAFSKVTPTGHAGPGMPGEKGNYAVVDLTPGEYIMVCFIPQGTLTEEISEETEAPPHAVLGMKQEFRVEA